MISKWDTLRADGKAIPPALQEAYKKFIATITDADDYPDVDPEEAPMSDIGRALLYLPEML